MSGVVNGLHILRMNDNGARGGAEDDVAVGQVLCRPTCILSVEPVAVVDVDHLVRLIGHDKGKSLVGGNPDAPVMALQQTPHIVGGESVSHGDLTALMLGEVIDIHTTTIRSYPHFQSRGEQVGDKRVDVSDTRRCIVQFLDGVVGGGDELQSEGGTDRYLTRRQLRDGLHVVNGIVAVGVSLAVEEVAHQTAHPPAAVLVAQGGIDVIVLQQTVVGGVGVRHIGLAVYLIDSLAIRRYQHTASWHLGGTQHHCALTTMAPLPRFRVVNANAVLGAHQHEVVRQGHHRVHIVVRQALWLVGHVAENGGGTADRTGYVYATRISANDNILPGVNGNTVNAVAVQHTVFCLVGVEQQRTFTASVTRHLPDTLTVNANEHRVVVIRTNAANGIHLGGTTCPAHKLVGGHTTLLPEGDDVQAVLIATQPQLARELVVVAALRVVRQQGLATFVIDSFTGTEQQTTLHRHNLVDIGTLHHLRQRGVLHHVNPVVQRQIHLVAPHVKIVQSHLVTQLLRYACHLLKLVAHRIEHIDGATIVEGVNHALLRSQVNDPASQMSIRSALVEPVILHLQTIVASHTHHCRPPDGTRPTLFDRKDTLVVKPLSRSQVGIREVPHLQGTKPKGEGHHSDKQQYAKNPITHQYSIIFRLVKVK